MSLVLDSSATLAWVHAEETTAAIEFVFREVANRGAWVPGIWRLEIGNVLEMGVRRGRHGAEFRTETLADLERLPIACDPETDLHGWGATAGLATRHGLALYDASYLELARRRGAPLATLDAELRLAACAEGVRLLGLEGD